MIKPYIALLRATIRKIQESVAKIEVAISKLDATDCYGENPDSKEEVK